VVSLMLMSLRSSFLACLVFFFSFSDYFRFSGLCLFTMASFLVSRQFIFFPAIQCSSCGRQSRVMLSATKTEDLNGTLPIHSPALRPLSQSFSHIPFLPASRIRAKDNDNSDSSDQSR
jgi:hypothetical protein